MQDFIQTNVEIVYEGQSVYLYQLNHQEVVKVLQPNVSKYQVALSYLQNEYELTKNLENKGVRRALRLDSFDQKPALFLEYVEGISLRKFDQKLSILEIVHLIIQLSECLDYIHQQKIIHKDINSNNIIINPENHKVTLIDFGISSRVTQKEYHLGNPKHLEGTLKYISPEQTGRVNKVIDYRTDLYSLGVVFYELLTGEVPFDFEDSMELIHAHITIPAPFVHEINPKVPVILSEIVSKLLKKNAENRYQTALGLKYDLEKYLTYFNKYAILPFFELGEKDFSGKLQLPQKLYGREAEIQVLLNAFERTSQGAKEWLLVGGYSGVGKSALIYEIHKPITAKKGYFISGKFDQYQRAIPYYALRQALAELVHLWLMEDEEIVEKWRLQVREALGDLAQVIIEIIPELELLIGQPAKVPVLEGEQYANRFNYVFGLFMKAICLPEHPLVIFIDDWQWADSASLELFKVLLADESLLNVLFIGAYRDNEIVDSHLFTQTLNNIQSLNITPVQIIHLKNLSLFNVCEWVEDALQQTPVIELSKLIYNKTNGNAFFTAQFLERLFEEKLLQFDFQKNRWTWDVAQIRAQNITDNVVHLMAEKIQKLTLTIQELLKIGACIGTSFDLTFLSIVADRPKEVCQKLLEEALQIGLILRQSHQTYRFVHDRIQQATYSLLSETTQNALHYAIGFLWLERVSEKEREEKLIDIVTQLNYGLGLIATLEERRTLLNINVQAAKKAKSSVAYVTAYEHFQIAGNLLPVDVWENHYDEAFELYKDWGEVAFLINKKEKSAELLEVAFQNAENIYHKTEIYLLRIRQKNSEAHYIEASNEGISALNLFGYNLPLITDEKFYTKIGRQELTQYLETIQNETPLIKIEELPILTQKVHLTCIRIINTMFDGVFMGAPYAYLYILAKAMNLSLRYGKSGYLPLLLTNMAIVHSSMKDYSSTYLMGQIAARVRSTLDFEDIKARFSTMFGYTTLAAEPIRKDINAHLKAFQIGLEVGDFAYAGYGIVIATRHATVLSLSDVIQHTHTAETFFRKSNNPMLLLVSNMQKGFILNVERKTKSKISFDHDQFIEAKFIETFQDTAPTWVMVYRRFKIQSLVIWQAFEEAYSLVEDREQSLAFVGAIDIEYRGAYYFYSVVIVVGLWKKDKCTKEITQALIEEALEEIKLLYEVNPSLFESIYFLVLAQKAEFEQRMFEAMNYYDKGIESALTNELTIYVALGNELAVQFYLSIQKPQFASLYLTQAINYYEVWGTEAKAKNLKRQYRYIYARHQSSQLQTLTTDFSTLQVAPQTVYTYPTETGDKVLDINTLLKASQTISKEIHLSKVLEKMLRFLIENAGADRGILLLAQGEEWFIQGEIDVQGNLETLQEIPLVDAYKTLFVKAINYILNTEELLVVQDISQDTRFAKANYVRQTHLKSLLCLPILNQRKLIGILYLENSIVTGVFSKNRVDLLQALATQVATAIENAMLYENLEEKVQERTQQLEAKTEEMKVQNEELTIIYDRLTSHHEILQKQKELVDIAHQKIRDSINYAKRIQRAILPEDERINSMIPQNFVFFRPRDVVSGDFYWSAWVRSRQGNRKIVFATADCTGHGVPGAFMSMIGANLLAQVVSDRKVTEPDMILTLLHGGIRNLLRQQRTKNRDGIDISINVIDWNAKTLVYSGAKRPLYYVQDGEMQQIKGNRYAVGGYLKGVKRNFEAHTVSFAESPIMAYTFSDGYSDQIGGKNARKFMNKHFRNMLFAISNQDMKAQKEYITQVFDKWIGGHRQIDDVLVVGMRLDTSDI